MAKLEKLGRDVCAFNHKFVIMFLPVCTSELIKINFHHIEHPIENNLRFGGIHAFDASPYKQFNELIKASYRTESKRRETCIDEKKFGLKQMQTNASLQTLCKKNIFLRAFVMKRQCALKHTVF